MTSKVLVPPPPFTKLQVKKSPPLSETAGFIISGDPAARVSHLEHSVRFLQEQHRLMLHGLHAEIEALRERNRELQFQLIFNKESSAKPTSPTLEEIPEINEEAKLKSEVSRLEKEASAARGEARAAEARALQLQRTVDAHAEYVSSQLSSTSITQISRKFRELETEQSKCTTCDEKAKEVAVAEAVIGPNPGGIVHGVNAAGGTSPGAVAVGGVLTGGAASAAEDSVESRAELRARLAEAEKLVRRLRSEAERRRREVLAAAAAAAAGGAGGAVTNLLFDGAAARHAHLQCMKNSMQASLRATGIDPYGFQNNYHFPPVHHTPDFWREPIREDFTGSRGRSTRRPLTLPELTGQGMHRATIYANNHTTRPRQNGFDKNKKPHQPANEMTNGRSPEQDQPDSRLSTNLSNVLPNIHRCNVDPITTYPELKIVVTKMIPHGNVSVPSPGAGGEARARPRRPHRKHAADHT